MPVRVAYVAALAENRPCNEDQASILLDILLQHGLPGLIGWRRQEQDLPDADYSWDHLYKRARAVLDWMPETAQAVVIERLRACVEANRQCQAGLSFRRLIEDGPSSRYRRRLQHRKPPDAFFQEIAQRWGMPTRTAYGLFRNLVISGLIGLIPKQQWASLVHQEIWNYLWMLKIGRVEDTVSMAALTAQINRDTQARNLPRLPKHIITTLFQHFPKDHYYNSGNIPRLVGVPQRRALKLMGVDRLHEHWLVIPLELPMQLVDPSQRPLGATCTALMVIDQGGATPVDLWVTDQPVTTSDIGLALYAAIFHPTSRRWPLRGIPEHIHVPSPFHEAPALQRAAHLLLAGLHPLTALETHLRDFPAIRQLIHALQQHYQPPLVAGRYRTPPPHATILQASQDIRTWVAATCFDAHQVKQAPPRFRTHGVDLPGHTTAAAGWLLPAVGQTTTIRNGVAWERRTYGASDAAIEPGEPVSIRMQPALWGRAIGLFIERAEAVRYLPLIRHKEHGYE